MNWQFQPCLNTNERKSVNKNQIKVYYCIITLDLEHGTIKTAIE